MEGFFKTLSNKDLSELSKAMDGKTVGDITYCKFDEEFVINLSEKDRERFNTMKQNDFVYNRFMNYLMSKKDLIQRSYSDQVLFFVSDLNYEIIKRFEELYP